jgi:hypothetical protein
MKFDEKEKKLNSIERKVLVSEQNGIILDSILVFILLSFSRILVRHKCLIFRHLLN